MAKRREFSAKIKLAAFERASGHCEGCGVHLTPGRYAYDHRIPDAMGGEPTLDNCQVLCSGCHGVKTAKGDVPTIAKSVRIRKRAAGIRPDRKITGWRNFKGEPVKKGRTR